MVSGKRKQGFSGLQRRVRPRREVEEPEIDENLSREPEMDEEADELSEDDGDQDQMDEDEEDPESDGSTAPQQPSIDISSVSFGALAKAQASMPAHSRRRKRGAATASDDESDSGPEEVGRDNKKPKSTADLAKRANKHAPTEMTSKRPVSRKREVIAVPKMEVRDPRFGPLAGPIDEAKARKAFAFLDEYRADEMKQLRAEIKKTKDPTKREEMQRMLLSMESKMKARQRKEKEQELMTEHKRREKELVKQGKQPFYLKKSEQKKRLLMDQFANMKKRQVDRTIERKRKKIVGRERKELDQMQRRNQAS